MAAARAGGRLRRAAAWNALSRAVSPGLLALAALCFGLGFLTVSCDVPGGYGRAAPGGTTTYTGVDLAAGGRPSVDATHLRPPAERADDDLGVEPLVAVSLLLVVAATAVAAVGGSVRVGRHHLLVAGLAAAAMLALAAGVFRALRRLEGRIGAQLPADADPSRYVSLGRGPLLCLALLALVTAGHLAASAVPPERRRWPRLRRRRSRGRRPLAPDRAG